MKDFEAYLSRIGLRETPSLQTIHLAHATSIPFENLDPVRGLPNSLDAGDLEAKMVRDGRGGYCFEQNLLLQAALEHLGVESIEPVLARVRAGGRPGPRPRTHLILKVRDKGKVWHADVGFGADGLLEPIPYGPGEIHEQFGWRYRVIDDGDEFVLQMQDGEDFVDLYGFIDEPALRVDMEVNNWYVCTSPRSPFTTALYCSYQEPGRRWIISERSGPVLLTTKTPTSKEERELSDDEVANLFGSTFHLPEIARVDGRWQLVD
ncbi:MAG TPA: arylamine N-acetyltransferase [Acidimicrobiales bacterium]|nr:arylamine N-acetyltransferase [Acidimicrobiales bacterium]